MDVLDFAIAGVPLAILIFGTVEAAKKFGITGQGSLALAHFLGFLIFGLGYAIKRDLIPEPYLTLVEVFVTAWLGSLAATGYYDFYKKRNT